MPYILRITFIIFTLLTSNISALASDAALSRIIGFSPDGKYFTFEQYGIGDVSGKPFSDIFFIDTIKNTWVEPPVRVLIDDQTADISKARILALAKATPTIKSLNTTSHGFILVSNPISQFGNDKYMADFGTNPNAPGYDRYKMQLTLHNAPNKKCESYAPDTKMFSLTLTSKSNQNITRNYADINMPSSRNCALDYSISEIHYFETTNNDIIFMALINIMSYGWEGLDRRFIAVPFYVQKQN
ncbi:MAG: DUF2259 domain-containing protein [Alphaproteobacteria bacterium]|nr:DUF2259 domain-containing protein [Alphaproteobacteria bacterium]